jgi:glycosyltransferase involved in cell wall biosynthesis
MSQPSPAPVAGVVFSKDRPLQLDATLASWSRHCCDAGHVGLTVLYTTSTPGMESLYRQVQREHADVQFVRETRFRDDLLAFLEPARHVLFVVDDCLFVRGFSIASAIAALAAEPTALGVSLRLGRNAVRSYAMNAAQTVPDLQPVMAGAGPPEWLRYRWPGCEHDFAYPLEVSSSLYRRRDLWPLLTGGRFRNPNQLEDALARRAGDFAASHPLLLTAETSLAFCNPCNRVQDEYVNRAGSAPELSSDALARAYADGHRVRVEAFAGSTPRGCHEEVELPLALSAAPVLPAPTPTPDGGGGRAAARGRPIRTAYISYLPGIDRGGQVNLVRLLEGLDRARHESLVVTPTPGPLHDKMLSLQMRCTVSPVLGPRPPEIWQRIANLLRATWLRRTLRRFRPDLLYVDAARHVRLVRKFGLSGGAPVLWHAQAATLAPKDIAAIRQADHVVAVAPHVQDLVRSLVPGMAVDCVPNAVDVDRFQPGADRSLRLELGVGDDELVVLYVGGLVASKGLADLLVAFATVRSAVPQARLWIVGSGAQEAELRQLADREGLAGHVAFLGVRNDVERLYRAADLFCLPSHSEGLPLCVLEAMASGRACVGSDVPGITHLLDGGCGIMVPVRDTAALADGLVDALRSPTLRESLGRFARRRVLERHRIETFVTGFDALLERIAGRAP